MTHLKKTPHRDKASSSSSSPERHGVRLRHAIQMTSLFGWLGQVMRVYQSFTNAISQRRIYSYLLWVST